MNETCATCKFFYRSESSSDGMGFCRRFPPTLMYMPFPATKIAGGKLAVDWAQQASSFPLVQERFYCGEWKVAALAAIAPPGR